MSLIVEDGSIVANANTYASKATVDEYHAARGNASWLPSSEDAEPAILRAMDYLESLTWTGTAYYGPVGGTGYQELQWPRYGVAIGGYELDYDEIPPQVIRALCEAALVEMEEPGSLAPDQERGGMIISQTVDVISTTYASGAPSRTVYNKILQHLRGLVQSSNVVMLTRA